MKHIQQWLAKRRLARLCAQNKARIEAGQRRDRDGRFAREMEARWSWKS
jgi:hypothetical protein